MVLLRCNFLNIIGALARGRTASIILVGVYIAKSCGLVVSRDAVRQVAGRLVDRVIAVC